MQLGCYSKNKRILKYNSGCFQRGLIYDT